MKHATPVPHDLSGLMRAIVRTNDQYGRDRAVYTPSDGGARLLLKQAVETDYIQDSYADLTIYKIPYTGEIQDVSKSHAALSQVLRRADSHTGWAGSGCNWTVISIDTNRKVVVIQCRSSISD